MARESKSLPTPALGVLEYSENLRKLVGKLPYYLHDRWRNIAFNAHEKGQPVTFALLVDFVQREARKSMDPIYGKEALTSRTNLATRPIPKPRMKSSEATASRTLMNTSMKGSKSEDKGSCQLCHALTHRLYKCKQFTEMTTEAKESIVKDKRLCFNCLRDDHIARNCTSSAWCKVDGCSRKHHTLLHIPAAPVEAKILNNTCEGKTGQRKLYFQLVPVYVCANGRSVPTVAMLDSASQLTAIHQSLANELGLKGQQKDLNINTMNSSAVMDARSLFQD